MLNDFLNSAGNAGVVKLEITADDLMKIVKEVVNETANSILIKFNEERTAEFIPRKKAMELLNVKTDLTMIRWEEKGYLNPHRMGGRVFYRMDEVIRAIENFTR